MSALPQAIQREVDAATAAQAALATEQDQAGLVTDASQLLGPTPQPEQVQAPPAKPTPKEPDWEHKYSVLQGMFNKAQAEIMSRSKVHESELTQLRNQVAELIAAKAEPATPSKEAPDPRDVENFGADMIEMVKRYADQTYQALAAQLGKKAAEIETRIAALEQTLHGVSAKTESTLEQQFYAALDAQVPDWRQINEDRRWLEWLGQVDPVYGATRQAALDHAHQSLDVRRVTAVFKAFREQFPAQVQSSLEDQVAPVATAGPSARALPDSAAKPVLSPKFVEKFFSDVGKNKYAGREAEMRRIEAEINSAAAEGRIAYR